MRFISILFFDLLLRQEMRMPFACRGERAVHRLFGVAAIGLAGLVSGERPALALCQLGFLQLSHAAVSTGIETEGLGEAARDL